MEPKDVWTEARRVDGGTWSVDCQRWVSTGEGPQDGHWEQVDILTGFRTKKAAVEAARAWRRQMEVAKG